MNILYLGWIGFNNFGDELLWRMFRSAASRKLAPGDELVPSVPGVDVKQLSRYDLIVLGGGSLLLPGYVSILREALGAGKRIAIWGSGYDCFHVPKSAGSGAVRPYDVKENAAYAAKLEEVLNGAIYRGVRGPWTKAYLANQGIDVSGVSVSGDAGLLACPDNPGPSARSEETKWIGINWGTVYNNLYGADEAHVESQLAQAAQALLRDGYRLYLYVVWGPDRKPTERLYERIGSPDRVVYDPLLRTEEEYAELMRGWDATLNLKLHASVMSAAAGIPFVSLGYRFKCFDFAAQLGTPELVVSTHESGLSDRLPDAVRSAIARRDALSASFADERVRTKERLESFFDLI